jgi:molybdenum cofactor cytidylyltransferase
MVLLGDMPLVSNDHINALISAFRKQDSEDCIVVATNQGEWGNPVLFGGQYFADLKLLEGDSGARSVMNAHREKIIEVEIGLAAAKDFDTPESFSN